jgi:TrmH RNA methyltransferase
LPRAEGGTPRWWGGGNDELRLYGWNAVLALFEARPQALRKLYLVEARFRACSRC